MTNIPPDIKLENVSLTPEEHRLIQTLRLLYRVSPDARLQIEQYVWSLVGQQLRWSFDDPGSLERAAEFSALDPTLRREMEAIEADFALAQNDGLEAP
jgi:hypothetical protein